MKLAIDLAREEGISYRQIRHWIAKGYIIATDEPISLTRDEERVARLMAKFVKFGFHVDVAEELARMRIADTERSTIVDIPGAGFLTFQG